MSFFLALIGFAALVGFVAFFIIPRLRKGNEKAFDTFNFLHSLRGWF